MWAQETFVAPKKIAGVFVLEDLAFCVDVKAAFEFCRLTGAFPVVCTHVIFQLRNWIDFLYKCVIIHLNQFKKKIETCI